MRIFDFKLTAGIAFKEEKYKFLRLLDEKHVKFPISDLKFFQI